MKRRNMFSQNWTHCLSSFCIPLLSNKELPFLISYCVENYTRGSPWQYNTLRAQCDGPVTGYWLHISGILPDLMFFLPGSKHCSLWMRNLRFKGLSNLLKVTPLSKWQSRDLNLWQSDHRALNLYLLITWFLENSHEVITYESHMSVMRK